MANVLILSEFFLAPQRFYSNVYGPVMDFSSGIFDIFAVCGLRHENHSAYSGKDGHTMGPGGDGDLHLQAQALHRIFSNGNPCPEECVILRQGTDQDQGGRTDTQVHQAFR